MKRLLGTSALLALAMAASPAAAQTASPAPNPADTPQVNESGEIVVTARRREERLQDVPIAVSAYSAATLEDMAMQRVEDLERLTPSFRMAPTSGRRNSSAVELRGIGVVETSVTQDTPIAFYQNEAIQSRPVGLNQSLFDIESVQVLKGPQGTLFGRNATAGALLITTRRPTDEFGGAISGTIGNFDRTDGSLILNAPLADGLSVRFAGQRLQRDGYTTNILTGEDLDNENVTTARLSVLFEPTGALENLLVVDYFDSESNGTGNVLHAVRQCATPPGPPTRPPLATCNATFAAPFTAAHAAQAARGIRNIAINGATDETASAWGITNVTTWDLSEHLTIKNIIGYRSIDLLSFQDSDGSPLSLLHVGPNGQEGDQLSNELQLQGSYDGFDWIIGGYYFREENEEISTSFQLGSTNASINNGVAENTSVSVFAQGTLELPVDGLSLTAGARYTHDEREAILRSRTGNGACRLVDATNVPISPCERDLSEQFDVPTYTVSLDYRLTADAMVYVAHRHGYRAGGFNIRATSPLQSAAFDPEEVDDFEIGAKLSGDFAGADYRLNLAAYFQEYSDIQRTVSQVFNGVAVAGVFNSADAEISGIEGDFTVDLTDYLSISGSYAYVDATHTRFDTVVGGLPVTLDDVPFGQAEHTMGGAITWSAFDSAQLGAISATLSFTSRSPWYPQQTLPTLEPEAYVGWQQLTNLTVDWHNVVNSPVSLHFFARNLFDQAYVQSELSQAASFGFVNRVYGEPLMYGLRATYAFGGER